MEKLKIIQDQLGESPREWCNLGTIAYKHPHYILGEETINDPIEWLEGMLNLENKYVYNDDRLSELENKFFDEYIALPIYLFDHSGITIRTYPFGCRWDSGKVGYIYMTKNQARKEYKWKRITVKRREKLLQYLEGEVDVYDQYLRGEVYGFVIEDKEGEHIDSCWGFYGTDWNNNGIKEHIPEELHEQLELVEIEY